MNCPSTISGCNYPQSECDGACAKKPAPSPEFQVKHNNHSAGLGDLHTILHVTPAGEFNWHQDADRLIEEGDFSLAPAMQHILRRLRAYEKPAKLRSVT